MEKENEVIKKSSITIWVKNKKNKKNKSKIYTIKYMQVFSKNVRKWLLEAKLH